MNIVKQAGPRLGGGLFLISATVLTLQVLLTRILSVQMWHHHSYMVVTMTLLGFGVAGALVTLRPSLLKGDPRSRLAWCGVLFGVTTILGYLLLAATADKAADLTQSGRFFTLSLYYSYLLIPYVFAGLVVVIILSVGKSINRLYFVNLVGSALGAWLFILLVTPLGAERLLVLCAATGPLAALAFACGGGPGGEQKAASTRLVGGVAVLVLLAAGGLFWKAPTWLEVQVASNKAEAKVLQEPGVDLLEVRWSPLCRLSVVEKPSGIIDIFQDGDAITVMHSDETWKRTSDLSLNVVGYVPHQMKGERSEMSVLAIGIGGGIDLRHAMTQGVKSVLGIEINGATVDLVGEDYTEFNGDVYHRPGVTVEVGEGRSTLRRLDEKFDHIQLSGTDTYTAGNSGAYVLSESYLYTSEALSEYFDHLTPTGTLGFIRLAQPKPREALRLVGIGMTALRERGIEEPSKHVVVLTHEQSFTGEDGEEFVVRFSACVFSLEPFAPEVLDYYARADQGWADHKVSYLPGRTEGPYAELAAAIDAGSENEFYASYPWDIRPVGDDKPFFFNFHHWGSLFSSDESSGESADWYEQTSGPIGLKILATLLIQTSVLVGLLVLLPLWILGRRGGQRIEGAGRHLAYFLSLGAGFMFLEISTAQRLVLFLGHPTYSLTVTLCSFLLFAGIGSLFAGRFEGREAAGLRRVVGLLVVVIVLLSLAFNLVLGATLAQPLWMRIAIVMALLAPMNFLMGMPYPMGLARLKRLEPRLLPLAQGVNGGASVIASILCIVVAMEAGFQVVSYAAAAIYLVGMLLFTTGSLAPGRKN